MSASLTPNTSKFNEEFDAGKSSQYRLTIQFALGGLSYALLDTENHRHIALESYQSDLLANNKYTNSFDTLIMFCQTAEIPIVNIIPDPTDTTFTRTINDTIGFVKVMDSLKAGRDNFNINDIKWVPFSQPQQNFELEAGMIKRSGIDIPVFEARTPYEVYLATPGEAFSEKEWNQRRDNAKAEKESINRYAGLKVGSMEEATTDGNWEKL